MSVNSKVKGNFGQSQKQRTLWDDMAALVASPLPAMKVAIKEVIGRAKLSRDQMADAMNRLAVVAGIRRRVSKDILDKWTAPTAEERIIHLEMLLLFCLATGDYLPLEVYVKAFPGVRVISEERYRVLEWAEAEINAREAKKIAKKKAQGVGLE